MLAARDLNFAETSLSDTQPSKTTRNQAQQIIVNLLLLCPPEIDRLQQLYQGGPLTGIRLERKKQRLSERSLHITSFKTRVRHKPFSTPPHMLRRSGLYYCSALLLQKLVIFTPILPTLELA